MPVILIKRTVQALVNEIIASLRPGYDLVYVDYRDQFSDEQIALIVKGDWESLWDTNWEWEANNRWDSCTTIVTELRDDIIRRWENEDDVDYTEIGEAVDPGTDKFDTLREVIEDRDTSNWVKDLAGNSGTVLCRILIDTLDEDHAFSYEQVTVDQVLDRIKFERTDLNVQEIGYALDNASPEFSTLMGYWIVSVPVTLFAELPAEEGVKVEISDPHLYLGNPFMGSGWITEKALDGKVVIDRADLRTDKDAFGYSVSDIYGGLYHKEFEAEFRVIPAEPATV